MPLDPKLQKFSTASPILTTYDYLDIEEGTGVVVFYGASSMADTTETYFLTRKALYSHSVNAQGTTVGAAPTFAKTLDLDFDLTTFNLPKRVKGTCRGNITVGGRTKSAAPNSWSAYAIIRIKKNDVEIANTQTATLTNFGGGAINVKESQMLTFSVSLATLTNFETGDTLRVTVEIWSHDNGSTNTGLGIDPKGRTDVTAVTGGIIEDAHSTVFEIHMPFALEV